MSIEKKNTFTSSAFLNEHVIEKIFIGNDNFANRDVSIQL